MGDLYLAGLIPKARPTPIPGMLGPVSQLFGYGLWLLALTGAVGVGIGVFKLVTSDKSRGGGGGEPFKWMGAGVAAVILSYSLISIINGIAG